MGGGRPAARTLPGTAAARREGRIDLVWTYPFAVLVGVLTGVVSWVARATGTEATAETALRDALASGAFVGIVLSMVVAYRNGGPSGR